MSVVMSKYKNMAKTNQDFWPWSDATVLNDRLDKEVDWPKITVVTPSYNQGEFLEAAIRSVIFQNYPNLEYLIIDGGSSDNSVEVIKKYEQRINFWQSKKDNGQADAIATGFAMATGEIFCWLNSDDIFLPGALIHVAKLFKKYPKTGFIYGNRNVIDRDGLVIGQHIWPYIITKYHWALGQYLAQESSFWRADLYRKVGGVDRSKFFIMDYDLFYRLWKITKFKKTSASLGCIRVHGETKNTKYQDIRISELSFFRSNYKLVMPGYFMIRFLIRFDALQVKFEKLLIK